MGGWIRQHKWRRLGDAFVSRRWQTTLRSLLGSPKDVLATVGGLASVVSLPGALIVH
jgi:hypothetical protein